MTACGADVAAYALGSLDDAERRGFERHLATCAVCPDELAVFEQVIAALAEDVPPKQAPIGLRRRIVADVRHDAAVRSRTATPRSRARRRPTTRLRRPAPALCALLVVAAAIAGTVSLGSAPGPRTRVIQARVFGGAGSAQVRRSSGHAELVVHHLSPPPSGEIYEVWLNRPGRRPQPTTALFNVTGAGDAEVDVPGDLRHVEQIMVTPEPAGGTQVPTHPAVITAQLT
jgi:anti-sigma-K factor RskA